MKIADLQENIKNDPVLEQSDHSDWAADYFRPQYNREIVNLVNDVADRGNLLEVGGAPFHLTYIFDQIGYDVTALDIDPFRFDAYLNAHDLDARECDIEREQFPVDDNSQDIILFSEVIEHLRINPNNALEEMYRVLRPGGRVILTTPQLFSLISIYRYPSTGSLTVQPYEEYCRLDELGHMGHAREYTPAEVRTFLEGVGFEILETQYANLGSSAGEDHSLFGPMVKLLYRIRPQLQLKQIHIATKSE